MANVEGLGVPMSAFETLTFRILHVHIRYINLCIECKVVIANHQSDCLLLWPLVWFGELRGRVYVMS